MEAPLGTHSSGVNGAQAAAPAAPPVGDRAFADRCEIVGYRPEFLEQILSLQTQLWSPDLPANHRYFDWKYRQNPYQPAPLIYAALLDGRVIGMRGFCGTCWEAGEQGDRYPILYADDLVVDAQHRHRGVVSIIMNAALADLVRRDHRYVINLSAGRITYLHSLASGWRSAGWVQPLRRPSVWPPLRLRVRDALARVPLAWRLADRLVLRGPAGRRRRPAARVTMSDSPRCEEMSALATRASTPGPIRHVRDAQYFAWRFRNPMCRYRYMYWNDPGLRGYLVLQQRLSAYEEPEEVSIVDFEATSDTARRELLAAALRVCRFRDVVIWSASLPTDVRQLLAAAGFESPGTSDPDAGTRPAVLVRELGAQLPDSEWQIGGRRLLDIANWDVRMLYSMHG